MVYCDKRANFKRIGHGHISIERSQMLFRNIGLNNIFRHFGDGVVNNGLYIGERVVKFNLNGITF